MSLSASSGPVIRNAATFLVVAGGARRVDALRGVGSARRMWLMSTRPETAGLSHPAMRRAGPGRRTRTTCGLAATPLLRRPAARARIRPATWPSCAPRWTTCVPAATWRPCARGSRRPLRVGPLRVGPLRVGPQRVEALQVGPMRAGPVSADPGNLGAATEIGGARLRQEPMVGMSKIWPTQATEPARKLQARAAVSGAQPRAWVKVGVAGVRGTRALVRAAASVACGTSARVKTGLLVTRDARSPVRTGSA